MLYSLLAPIMLQVVTIAMDIATNFIKGVRDIQHCFIYSIKVYPVTIVSPLSLNSMKKIQIYILITLLITFTK